MTEEEAYERDWQAFVEQYDRLYNQPRLTRLQRLRASRLAVWLLGPAPPIKSEPPRPSRGHCIPIIRDLAGDGTDHPDDVARGYRLTRLSGVTRTARPPQPDAGDNKADRTPTPDGRS